MRCSVINFHKKKSKVNKRSIALVASLCLRSLLASRAQPKYILGACTAAHPRSCPIGLNALMNVSQRFNFSLAVLFLNICYAHAFPISVVDDLNRTITILSSPGRIVSLAPSITETLFAVGADDQIVGVTDYCNYPEEAKLKTRVGGVINPSIETIISLKPDLIILSMEGNVREDFNELVSFGIPVFVTNPRTLSGIHKSIGDLGTLTGHAEQAAHLVQMMLAREDSLRSAALGRKRKVLFIVSLQPLIVVGSKTFVAELLDLAGGLNIGGTSSSTYPTYSREAVVAENPEVLLVMSGIVAEPRDLIRLFPEWERIDAIRTQSVFTLDADIVSRPGPRAVNALETLSHIFHGEQK
jgi:iron complex transport system substrate-binding protein